MAFFLEVFDCGGCIVRLTAVLLLAADVLVVVVELVVVVVIVGAGEGGVFVF